MLVTSVVAITIHLGLTRNSRWQFCKVLFGFQIIRRFAGFLFEDVSHLAKNV